MVAEPSVELTEDEAELYDRQIRLWGLDSQKRLRSARILLIGLKGYGAEVAKNIILAGVKTVTFLDDGLVTEDDACSQFLAPIDSVGKPRAEASLSRAQALNPMVKVTAENSRVEDKPDEYFGNFDVVVVTECKIVEVKRINTACRMRNVKFFCGDVFGQFGFSFSDLQIHEFAEEITKFSQNSKEPPTKVTVKQTDTFVPLVEALSVDWTTEENVKRLPKLDYSYFLMRVLHEFRACENRDPTPSTRNEDIEKLKNYRSKVLSELSVPNDKIPDTVLQLVFGKVSPVCAIVGGVLAQEVIKVVSQKEAPHNNFFFFNPEKCCGFIETHASGE